MGAATIVGTQRCAIYVRVSSAGQEDGYSLETQEDHCRKYAEAHGLTMVSVYRDIHTGAEWRERPGLSQLREAVRQGDIDVVLAFALDRLSRKQAHIAILAEEIAHAGARLEFVTEQFEETSVGEFIRSAKAFAAEIEREKLAERTVRGRIARVRSGKLIPGSRAPYGYRWRDETKGQLDEDSITGPIVRRMFSAIAGGMSLHKLARTLDAEQIPTPTGRGFWHSSTLSNILHRPAYKGDAYGWGIRKAGMTPQRFDPEKAIRLPNGTIPPLVDAATWDAVQVVLKRNKAQSIRSAKNPEAALLRGGFVRCGTCGRIMHVRPRSDGGVDYYCGPTHGLPCPRPTTIKGSVLDPAVWHRVRSIITDPLTVSREIARLQANDPTIDEVRSVGRLLDDIERQRRNLTHAVAMLDDADAMVPLVAQLRSLTERRRALEAEHSALQQRQSAWQSVQADLDNLARWCATVSDRVDDLSWDQRRVALTALNFSVAVYPKNHDPRYVITADIDVQTLSTTT
jgi:site-specific DNA recombinase